MPATAPAEAGKPRPHVHFDTESLKLDLASVFSQRTKDLEEEEKISTDTFKVSFLNGKKPNYLPSNELIEKRNYLKGNDPTKWSQSINAFETITYQQIYTGIDFTIQEKNNTVKYEFIIQPGAKPKQIQLAYEGVENIPEKVGMKRL